jgi:putative hydrolase of the HAD superfamily
MGRGGNQNEFTVSNALAAGAKDCGERLLTASSQRKLQILAQSKSLIIDMDDTLITNQIHFDQAQHALIDIYQRMDKFSRSKQVLEDLHNQVDAGLIPELGYTPNRWFTTARRVGELVKSQPLTETEEQDIDQAADLAMSTGQLLTGVKETLDACLRARVPMILKTKGCQDKQQEKLMKHQFHKWFSQRIWIVKVKDVQSFKSAQQKFNLNNPISIGDSYRSDILPAKEAGFEAILIDKGAAAWQYETSRSKQEVDVASVEALPHAIEHLLINQNQEKDSKLRPANNKFTN